MLRAAWTLVILVAAFNSLAAAAPSEDEPSSLDESKSSEESLSTDVEPAPASALGSVGPLLSLLQPVIGGILNGPGSEGDASEARYPPLLKPLFSPLPVLPGFGIIPSTLAAQASDLLASTALSARMLFANSVRESAARSQVNYAAILDAINDLNNPTDNPL